MILCQWVSVSPDVSKQRSALIFKGLGIHEEQTSYLAQAFVPPNVKKSDTLWEFILKNP